jgi:cytochrome c-type biogenesis protein CcmH/NrfG
MPPSLLELAQRATQATPNSGAAWHNLGLILQQDGAFSEAFDAYGRALALDPNYHQVALALAF